MITDSYDIETEPMINLFDFYGRRGDFADICLIIFSKEIHRHLLDSYESEIDKANLGLSNTGLSWLFLCD